jgi:dihydrofolate reductase
VVASEYVSLDGIAEEPGQWSIPYFSDDLAKYKTEELLASDALLLGRVTYEAFAAAWPKMTELEGDFAVRMNSLPKYVASTTLEEAEWNASVIKGDVAEEVSKLKQEPGQNLLIGGSFKLVHTLMDHGLIDEYRVLIHPVIVGQGRRLFEDENKMTQFKLTGTQTFESGVVALTYEPAE